MCARRHAQQQNNHVVDARSMGSRVDFQSLGSASGLRIEPGLPELEGHIDPGKLLLTLNLELDKVGLGIHHLLSQLLLLDPVEEHIVDRADIILEKPHPGVGRQEKD